MYKRASRNLQHAHRVDAPLPTGGYIGAEAALDDLLPSAGNMSLPEVRAERVQLRAEQVRLQADLTAAKARHDRYEVARIGQVLQLNGKRAAVMRGREHELVRQHRAEALADAIRELVPDMASAIFQRANELGGTGSHIRKVSQISPTPQEPPHAG